MTDTTTPIPPQEQTAVQPPAPQPKAKRVIQVGIPALCIGIIAVVVLGFVGGIASHAMFPSKTGPAGAQGKEGKQGPVGEAGPQGPVGDPANLNLANIGYCINVDYQTGSDVTFVNGVSISAPVLTNGTQSCPNGTFTPLQPTSN